MPAISWILSAFTVTSPEVTVKSVPSKDAIPLFVSVLHLHLAMVITSSPTVVSIPSPPVKVNVFPVVNVSSDPLSARVKLPEGIEQELQVCEHHHLLLIFRNWS